MSLSIIAARAQLLVIKSSLAAVNHECVFADGVELENAREVQCSLWRQEADLLGIIGDESVLDSFI